MGFELGSTIIKEIYRSLDLYHCPLFVLLSFVFKQFSIEKLKTSLGFELGSSKEKVSMLTTRPLLYHCSLFFLLSLFISSVRTIVFQIWKLVLKPDRSWNWIWVDSANEWIQNWLDQKMKNFTFWSFISRYQMSIDNTNSK